MIEKQLTTCGGCGHKTHHALTCEARHCLCQHHFSIGGLVKVGKGMSQDETLLHELELVNNSLANQVGTLDRLRASIPDGDVIKDVRTQCMLVIAVDAVSEAIHRVQQTINIVKGGA